MFKHTPRYPLHKKERKETKKKTGKSKKKKIPNIKNNPSVFEQLDVSRYLTDAIYISRVSHM